MTKTLFTTFVSILAFIRALSITPASAQETAGQILAKLEKLSAEDRQKVLVERAKNEKEITFYSSLQTADAEPYVKAFNKRYPFIKVNIYRISGQKQVIMIQSEFNAGRHAFDITNASAAQAFGIKKTGALDPYQSPQRQYFSSAHKDKEGYFTPTYIVPVVLGYNTNMVKRNEAPKRYEDLLEPRWKSNMILDIEEFPWFAVMLKHYGREKGLDYMKRLAKQEILMGRGRTTQAQLISAGERALGIALNSSSVVDFKTRGAPLDWTILDPYYAKPNMLMLARHAPHPPRSGVTDRLDAFRGRTVSTSGFGLCGSPQGRETKPTGAIREGELSRRSRLYWSDLGRDRQRFSQRVHRRSLDRNIARAN